MIQIRYPESKQNFDDVVTAMKMAEDNKRRKGVIDQDTIRSL